MRLIDADRLMQVINNKAAFEGQKAWSVYELKKLIQAQVTIDTEQQISVSYVRRHGGLLNDDNA